MLFNIVTAPFNWQHSPALWQIRRQQLADDGIFLAKSELPIQPLLVERDGYEWDYHHMAKAYLHGAGGFWLAWLNEQSAGQVAAQAVSGAIDWPRPGGNLIGALCQIRVKAIELWTDLDGLGHHI